MKPGPEFISVASKFPIHSATLAEVALLLLSAFSPVALTTISEFGMISTQQYTGSKTRW